MKKVLVLIVLLACCSGLSGTGPNKKAKEQVNGQYKSLTGLDELYVLVDEQLESAKKLGISEKDLQSLSEQKLKAGNIAVINRDTMGLELLRAAGQPFLHIKLNTQFIPNSELIVCHIELEFNQDVLLARNLEMSVTAVTWQAGTQVVLAKEIFAGSVKKETGELVDKFLEDYRRANPESVKPEGEKDKLTGTVKYIDLEGGFYGIVADDGQKYDPVNLPDKYKKDGLKIRFKAKEKGDVVGVRMWGKIAEITEIETAD